MDDNGDATFLCIHIVSQPYTISDIDRIDINFDERVNVNKVERTNYRKYQEVVLEHY
ncbi:hypothetical protein E3AUHO_45460 [Klebsiella pneumoniae subsp. pneumoniae]|jgi:hypothetical protein|uniref:Uncharacterized protein n=1 Tax=Klebsiella pneumoniae TaxID=573 RepID=A0A919HW09_KLEPN|nr:hypothetical protein D364_01380 [Klebsiella pneumoniae CG43]AHE46158.1 hypothetical protein KP13_02149 [Klebsiella pneumoniae subsp. pneumoniae Kp13]AJB33970.1 hypothetical protein P244_4078 [Klebsiella pneumoniae HK787]EJK92380.1 hypothetical protein UUU_07150 [Klebsiella pneumoniae subsp. pneumoniae DSM 30104 = JCM 1662 = NBRC 14940]MCB8843337.1 hypothetical protein [Klebsiella pneumoniae]BDA91860.1 hypothetical protein E3AUHO_45460 [Klebsiella pneumoniae subsp. pneumoniae]